MQNEIQKYEPMMQAICKDGRILIYPKWKDEGMAKVLKTETFVNIEGVRVNKFEIKYMEDLPEDYDVILGLPDDVRNAAIKRFQEFELNINKKPSRHEKLQIIEKLMKKKNERFSPEAWGNEIVDRNSKFVDARSTSKIDPVVIDDKVPH